MPTFTGLDVLLEESCGRLQGKSIGLLCNQASITRHGLHVVEALLFFQREGRLEIKGVFGPQHGVWGHTQDNMVEWEGYRDPRTGLNFHSLYGARRWPTAAMLEGIDLFVVDIPDVGARYYTFIWTMALCMRACSERGTPFMVLDRPNPIGGVEVEGTVLDSAYSSVVGLHPLPMRHGMTVGEISKYLQGAFYPKCRLEVVEMRGWSRPMVFEDTGLLWAVPSPNMPTRDTALAYPGMCLFEGTNLSEGRGTTRPFETFGAPFVDGWKLCEALDGVPALRDCGVLFRPVRFQPTFQKHVGKVCGGGVIHVLDRERFRPVLAAVAILQEVVHLWPKEFEWLQPPYEYEAEKLPFDILAGNGWLRRAIEDLEPLEGIRDRFASDCSAFEPDRVSALLYS